MTTPNTLVAIQHLVTFADQRLKDRYLAVTNRALKIFHPDDRIRSLNYEASTHLNDLGCKLFFRSLCRFEEKRNNMELVMGGVGELFDDQLKSYTTTSNTCSCRFFANYEAACSHIIFIRRLDNMHDDSKNIFDKEIFHVRYHRNQSLINVLSHTSDSTNTETSTGEDQDLINQNNHGDILVDEETNDIIPVMDDRKKFKKVMPLLVRMANIVSVFGTKQFLEYYKELQVVEKKMRRGSRIFPENNDGADAFDNNNNEAHPDDQIKAATEGAAMEDPNDDLDDTVPQEEDTASQSSGSKFKAIIFKEAVKCRGRPKKKSKQVSFNRTALDRKRKPKKKVSSSKKLKSGKVSKDQDFIDDDETTASSDAEESIEDVCDEEKDELSEEEDEQSSEEDEHSSEDEHEQLSEEDEEQSDMAEESEQDIFFKS